MRKWIISKEFDFCYGHRVWSQTLNQEYSIDNRCVCRHLHGHQGKIIVQLEANELHSGMVTDFKHLNWFKKFLDDTLDHKFIIDKSDPMFDIIVPHMTYHTREIDQYGRVTKFFHEHVTSWIDMPEGYSIIDPNYLKTLTNDSLVELLEGYVAVNFVPTSENLSKWLFEVVKSKMLEINVVTNSVKFYETPKSSSYYEQQN